MIDCNDTPLPALKARVFPLKEEKGNLLAFASVTLAGCFAIGGIKVLAGENGLFVGMPSMSDGRGGFRDIAFPTTVDMRAELNKVVLDAYSNAIFMESGD